MDKKLLDSFKSNAKLFVETNPLAVLYSQKRRDQLLGVAKGLAQDTNPAVRAVGRASEGAISTGQSAVSNLLSGGKQFAQSSYRAVRDPVLDIMSGGQTNRSAQSAQNLLSAGQGAVKTLKGASQIVTTPVSAVLGGLAGAIPDQRVNRFLTGVQRGITDQQNVGAEVAPQNVKVGPLEFDPLLTAGSFVGFTRNPMWRSLFPATSKLQTLFNPSTKSGKVANFVFGRLSKGGIEGLVQGWSDMPENATPEEKVKHLLKNAGFGALAEISVDTALKGVGSINDKYTKQALTEMGDKVDEFVRRMRTPVKTTEIDPVTGLNKVVPMWQEWAKNKFQPKNRGGFANFDEMTKLLGDTPPNKGGVPEGGVNKFTEFLGKSPKDAENAYIGAYNADRLSGTERQFYEAYSSLIDKGLNKEQIYKQLSSPQPEGGVTGITSQATNIETPTPKAPEIQTQAQRSLPEAVAQVEPSTKSIVDPVKKITQLLKEATPMREQTEKLYSQARSKRVGALVGIGKNVKGEQGFYAQLGAMKGELPKVQFSRIRQGLEQTDIDSLYQMVEDAPRLLPLEKLTAKGALNKLLGMEGGQVPTEGEISLMRQVFPEDMIKEVLDKRPFMEKMWSGFKDALNIPRSAMATLDMSAPLRQGWMMMGRPKTFLKNFGSMFKMFASESNYKNSMDEIASRPTFLKMKEAGVALTDLAGDISKREEQFASNLVEKIPLLGAGAKASNRAYSGFLNKLRADVFDDLYQNAIRQGREVDGKLLEDIGKFVNNATGRGDLPKFLKESAPILNATFFSPRLLFSRLNTLNPVYYAQLDPFVRKEALKTLLGTTAITGTILGLSKLAGAEVGTDPRSADFGKIKIGNTRYDMLGGYQQYIKLASQLYTGQIVSSTTGRTITLGEGYKPLSRKDILLRFFEGKESPIASFVTDMITGTDIQGEPIRVSEEVVSRFIPLILQDMASLTKEWGPKGVPMALPGFFGVGSQTYGRQEIVEGQDRFGEPTTEVKPVKDLPATIVDKILGERPIRPTSQFSMDAFFKQFQSMDPAQKNEALNKIKTNPDLLEKFLDSADKVKKGITPDDETLKGKGVKNGDRAAAVVKELNKLKSSEEKKAKLKEYVSKGVVTEEVLSQIAKLLK